ncbi:hypothetical protein F4677DRAFT_446323 [Hypoxylon crocopeplum]|nr:hypothetical protein F4677DRAFT_446323 [Hypoxylon crocopeplum]
MMPGGWRGKAVGIGTAVVGLLSLADLGLAQSATAPTCLQPITGSTPTVAEITNFLNPLIDQACTALGSDTTQDTGFVVPVANFNKTGYLFAKINVENVAADMGECRTAFQSIISGCISEPPAGTAPNFGGQWASSLKLSYTLVSLVYPDKNPLADTPPPPASSSQSSSASRSSPTMSTTSVSSISRFPPPPSRTSLPTMVSIPPRTSSGGVATTTQPPGGGSSGTDLSDIVEEVAEALALAAAAAAVLLAASFLIAVFTPLVAEVPALAALVAIEDAESVVAAQLARLKPTDPVLEMSDKVFAARFAGLMAQGVPNPVTAGLLVSAIAIALETVPAIVEEVEKQEEEEQNSSSNSASTSTASSTSLESPEPTGPPLQIVSFSKNWPDLLLDVITEFFPDEGEGDLETVDELSLKYYATNMTDGLANAISWLPIFNFIVPDEIPLESINEDNARRRRRDEGGFSGNAHARAAADADLDHTPVHVLDKRTGANFPRRQSPFKVGILPTQQTNPPLHLRLVSFKENLVPIWSSVDKQPPLVDGQGGRGVSIHVIDSGVGTPDNMFPADGEFSNGNLIRHVPDLQRCYDNTPQRNQIPVPTRATQGEEIADEDPHSHGTCVLDIAGGLKNGFATKATFHSWKDSYEGCEPSTTGLINIFKRIANTITTESRQKKSVINYSQGKSHAPSRNWKFWDSLLQPLWKLEAVFVVSGGSDAKGGFTKDFLPQAVAELSSNDNPVIVVGGVSKNGQVSPTNFRDTSSVKRIAVYALDEVTCFKSDLVTEQSEIGTSFAAPAVAGVIASWLAVPEFVTAIDALPGTSFAFKVRSFLVDHALDRSAFPGIPTLYNGWVQSLCEAALPPAPPPRAMRESRQRTPSQPELAVRQQADDEVIPIVENGTLVDPNLAPTFCPLPGPVSSTTTSSATSTATSSTSPPTSSSSPLPGCDPQITCDACGGTFSAGHDGLAACTTGASKGCQCVPGSNQCGMPQPCSKGGCAGTTDVGTQGATCKGNFKGCPCTVPCDSAAPPILDGALNIKLYNDTTCCSAGPTIKIADLDKCLDTPGDFYSFHQAVGQSLFSRGITIQMYPNKGCTGSSFINGLTNAAQCWSDPTSVAWKSFKISNSTATTPTPPSPPSDCTPVQPVNTDSFTVTLNVYANSCCDAAPFQVIKAGTLNACHQVTTPFAALTQAVGQNLLSRGVVIQAFSDDSCVSDSSTIIQTSNDGSCVVDHGDAWQSFMLVSNADPGTPDPDPGCTIQQPGIADTDTISVNLYANSCCDAAPVQTLQLDEVNSCVNTAQPFADLTQSVGQDMFGRNLTLIAFPQQGCTGLPTNPNFLTNNAVCHPSTMAFNSIMISGASDNSGGSGSEPPAPFCPTVDNKGNPNTLTLSLYKGDCCIPKQNITIGVPNSCHDLTSVPEGFKEAVGSGMFANNYKIVFYQNTGCTGTFQTYGLITQSDLCLVGGPWKSVQVITPPPPPPPPPSCAGAPNNKGNDNTITLDFYKGDCCTPKSTLTIGTASIGKCEDVSALGPEGFKQSVGQNLFGRNLLLVWYFTSDCSGGFLTYPLTNTETACQVGPGPYKSVRLFDSTPPPPCAGTPDNKGNPNTMTLDFYKGDCCHPKSTVTVGVVNTCHNLDGSPEGFHQSVGQNLFGKGYRLVFYVSQNCGGGFWTYDLTNKDACWTGGPWKSFKLFAPTPPPPPPPPAPQCGSGPNIADDKTLSMVLFSDAKCCHAGEVLVQPGLDANGVHTGCINLNAKMFSIEEAVGQNLFGRDNKIRLFPAKNCASGWNELQLTNSKTCWFSSTDGWMSMQMGNFESPPTLPPPPPPPSQPWTVNMYTSNSCLAGTDNFHASGFGPTGCQSAPAGFNSFCPQEKIPAGLRVLLFEADGCSGGGASLDSTSSICTVSHSCTEFDNIRSFKVVVI